MDANPKLSDPLMDPIQIPFCNELCLLLFFKAITEAKRTLTVLLSLYEIKATYMSLKVLHGEDGKHCFFFFMATAAYIFLLILMQLLSISVYK